MTMRLAVFTDSPAIWGAELTLMDLMSQAAANGVDAVIFAPTYSPIHESPRLGSPTRALDLPVHPALAAGGIRQSDLRSLIAEPRAIFRSAELIANELDGFDVAMSFSLWRNEDVVRGARRAGLPAVLDLHETFVGRTGRLLSSRTLRRAQMTIAPSQYVARVAGATPMRTAVVPRAMAFDLPERDTVSRSFLRIGMLGQLQPHKGHELLIRAALRAASEVPLEVVIAGADGHEETQAAVIRATQEHPGIFRWVGRVTNPLEVMAQCDGVINASEHEAFGRTVIEALAVGAVPIVVNDAGPAETVRDTGLGILFDRSTSGLSDAIVSLARDEPMRAIVRKLGPRTVAERFSLTRVARAYFEAVRQALR